MRLRTFSPSSSTVLTGMNPAFSNARHERPFRSSGSVTTALIPGSAETTSRINFRIAVDPGAAICDTGPDEATSLQPARFLGFQVSVLASFSLSRRRVREAHMFANELQISNVFVAPVACFELSKRR